MKKTIAAVFAAATALTLVGCTSEQDPWEAFVEQVNKGGGESKTGRKVSVNDKALRKEFDQAKVITCKMSRDDLLAMKGITGMGSQEQANRAANQLGAMWEFACDKGHDPEMYKPVKATGSLEMPSAPPEPDWGSSPATPEPAPEPSEEPMDVEAWPPWSGTVYTYGDCDPDLIAWQLQMNTYGYDFQGTGCYYEETKEAVLDLQEANDLDGSGRIGPATWDAAWDGVPPTR